MSFAFSSYICFLCRGLKDFFGFFFFFFVCVVRAFSLFLCDLDPPSLDEKNWLSTWNKIKLESQIKPHAQINSSWNKELTMKGTIQFCLL